MATLLSENSPITMPALPIDEILPQLLLLLENHPNCILHAPPGAGKTTGVPLALLNQISHDSGRIIMLEPRRLAAVSAARWMAHILGEEVGKTVGYSIRFESKVSSATRIEVVTEAILTRRIQNDPMLEGVGMVIFDEFHERSIHADLGLALCLDLQRQVRGDLKILVMSATLETGEISALMGNAPVISSAGRFFPVEEIYLDDQKQSPLPARMAAVIMRALRENDGDLLAFLPGAGEIRSCAARLTEAGLAGQGVSIHQLYGDLPFDEQQVAILPGRNRKVVLATSIAETSLTIEGVRIIVDSGLSRRLSHDPASGMNRLVTIRESRASAEQRKGRGGRLAPGVCYRLFSRHTFSAMTAQTTPEILDSDLSPLLLELAAWGVREPFDLAWLDPPPVAALSVARQLLINLAALNQENRITPLGFSMARMPLHPRLARLLLRSIELECPRLGCDIASLLSERDIVRRNAGGTVSSAADPGISDRVDMLRKWRETGRYDTADSGALKNVERVSRQLLRLLNCETAQKNENYSPVLVSRLLLSAYPDRIAMKREGESGRYIMPSGRGVRLSSAGHLFSRDYLVAVSVDGGDQAEGIIHLAAEVSEELLRDELDNRIGCREIISWNNSEGRIIAVREEYLGAISLTSKPFVPDQNHLLPVVIEAVRASALSLLTRDESFLQLQARVMLLQRNFPADGWPDFSDLSLLESLDTWLASFLSGVRNATQLAAINCATALHSLLEYRHKQMLGELAPTHLLVPSGSRIRFDYCKGDYPVLAVKLQELFGLAEGPTIAGGKVAVLLHILSPAGRPLQVTMDLKRFWDGSYHQIKKEMKGRYPKHPWPDDPWSAVPTRRVKHPET